jgi:GNAT superfamily N-acetyltransferase
MYPRLPDALHARLNHRGRRIVVRPIRDDDLVRHRRFAARISPQDLYRRFFSLQRELPEAQLVRFTHIDYEREMAFVATALDGGGAEETLGVVRACADADGEGAEVAVLVRSDLKGQGLGRLLMHRLWMSVLSDNLPMLRLAASLGFRPKRNERNIEEMSLELPAPPAAARG